MLILVRLIDVQCPGAGGFVLIVGDWQACMAGIPHDCDSARREGYRIMRGYPGVAVGMHADFGQLAEMRNA